MGFEFFVGQISPKKVVSILENWGNEGKLKTQNTKPKTFPCSILL